MSNKTSILFLSHGGGPRPILDTPDHRELVEYWQNAVEKLPKPDAILVISAHWEEDQVRVTAGSRTKLYYDYYGFPEETYHLDYPCPGEPHLAQQIVGALNSKQIEAKLNFDRGLDHGVFVPLLKMYPKADIPVVEMSLLNSLDAKSHIDIGEALKELNYDNLLVIGSGFSFHNLPFLRAPDKTQVEEKNKIFQNWLIKTCSDRDIQQSERYNKLINWEAAPHARFCAPREEHLLPLHVCAAMANQPARESAIVRAMGVSCCCFQW